MDTKANILIVDDDPKVSKTLSDIVRARGYTPRTASKGKTALHIVGEDLFDVAIVDLVLEDMPGLEVMRRIKKRCPETECIVLTGYATRASAVEAVNLGAYGFVEKPFNVEQLLLMIGRAISGSSTERSQRKGRISARLSRINCLCSSKPGRPAGNSSGSDNSIRSDLDAWSIGLSLTTSAGD